MSRLSAVSARAVAALPFALSFSSALSFLLVLSALIASPRAARAQDPAEAFYAGKTIRLIVGYAPGATADHDPRVTGRTSGSIFPGPGNAFETYANVLARHLGRFVPGRPKVVVQFMPGAGGLVAAGYLAQKAAPDGLTLAIFNPTNTTAPLIEPGLPVATNFDPRRFGWLGSMNRDVGTCAFWSRKVQDVEDLRRQQIVIGGTGPMASSTLEAVALRDLLGFKFRLILGYPSLFDIRQPAEGGEVDGYCGLLVSALNDNARLDLAAGKFRIVLQTGLEPHPDLPSGIPNVFDLAPNEETRQIFRLVFGPWAYGKPIATPPGVPPERLDVLRRAFRETVEDREFLAEAARAGLEVNYVPPDRITTLLDEFYAIPAPVLDRARSILGTGGGERR